MPVYPVEAGTRVPGCVCRDRVPRYPSDLTDEQWRLLEPEARGAMAELRKGPMTHFSYFDNLLLLRRHPDH
jgi:hypothetical protein